MVAIERGILYSAFNLVTGTPLPSGYDDKNWVKREIHFHKFP
jgi:hypothetical protein